MRRLYSIVTVMLLAGCGGAVSTVSESQKPDPSPVPGETTAGRPSATDSAATPEAYRVCDAQPGTVTDVANEPGWRQYADYFPWTTANGCLVRIDVLADLFGPGHCGSEAARVINVGVPIGAMITDVNDAAVYVRDPDNVFGDPATASGFDPDAELPDGAISTDFRQGSTELWADPADPSAIYLVTGTSIERWPLDPEPAHCS